MTHISGGRQFQAQGGRKRKGTYPVEGPRDLETGERDNGGRLKGTKRDPRGHTGRWISRAMGGLKGQHKEIVFEF